MKSLKKFKIKITNNFTKVNDKNWNMKNQEQKCKLASKKETQKC